MSTIQDLMRPPAGMDFDFTEPKGEPALAPANSISWQIFKNPVSLFIGGVAAVILELAEPSVRAGVWDHSSFRKDPAMRLRRTGFAAMMTVYGPQAATKAMIGRVRKMHDRVQGVADDGTPYRASDPRLLDWVQATATFGFVEAYSQFVSQLSLSEKSQAFGEAVPAAQLYGATNAPRSWEAWQQLLSQTASSLEGSNILSEFLDVMSSAAILPRPLGWVQRLLVRAAVDIVPNPVRGLPQLRGRDLRFGEFTIVRGLAQSARLLPLRGLPPGQAARRLRK